MTKLSKYSLIVILFISSGLKCKNARNKVLLKNTSFRAINSSTAFSGSSVILFKSFAIVQKKGRISPVKAKAQIAILQCYHLKIVFYRRLLYRRL